MKPFQGFPSRMEFTSVPNLLFSAVLPQIDDLAELRVTLLLIAALYRKKGAPRYGGKKPRPSTSSTTRAAGRPLGGSLPAT
jgi:hypothetical protein